MPPKFNCHLNHDDVKG
ncbi:hypothetical protein DBR06_SOUSAS34110006, partial [Sousa chinensis]